MATHGPDSAEAFAPPEDLGRTSARSLGGRGLLAAAAADDGAVAVMHRAMPTPCDGGPEAEDTGDDTETAPDADGTPDQAAAAPGGDCVRFFVRRLGAGGDARRGVPIAAPRPCARGVVGHLWASDVWYYGVCTAERGPPASTVYAIQFDPEYAHAERLLEGCEPAGIAPLDEGVLVSGGCGGDPRAVWIAEAGRRMARIGEAAPTVACREGRPVLSVGEAVLTLSGPVARIETLLPDELAPPGARAAWTGEAILVARPVGPEVSLRRYQCDDGELGRTDVP